MSWDGTLDVENIQGDDRMDQYGSTRDALLLLLHPPGTLRQDRWPYIVCLPHSMFALYWSDFILMLVLAQAVVVPVEATFRDV